MSDNIYIVYETTNLVNGKFYIGVHKLNGRNYLGSGKILALEITKHGRKNFHRETLASFECESDAYERERELVNDSMIQNPHCYNIVLGGMGGGLEGELNGFYGRKHSEETLQKMSDSRKGMFVGEDHWTHNNTKMFEYKDRCIGLYLFGYSIADIAEHFGVGDATIFRCLKEDANSLKLMNERNPKNKRVLTEVQINEVHRMNHDGDSLRKIGKFFNISHHTVKKYLAGEHLNY